jgi:internalin A
MAVRLLLCGLQPAAHPETAAAACMRQNCTTALASTVRDYRNRQPPSCHSSEQQRLSRESRSFSGFFNEFLGLSGNGLTGVPECLGKLTNLRKLSLANNKVTEIPAWLAELSNLEILDLQDNQLVRISESVAKLPRLCALFLHGNPQLALPPKILGPTAAEIKTKSVSPKSPKEIFSYLFVRSTGARPMNEAKLILVGQGGVGKSSLVKTLKGEQFKEGEQPTEGIKISDWQCPLKRKQKATLHIWDFGGQEMMHATHQFFLTARSLYLLVLNRRMGGIDREADYWFRLIRAFGGNDAPVIVVLNKQKKEPFDVNRGGWLEKYAGNIKSFVETDCADKASIRRLQTKIQEQLREMQSLKESFPSHWFDIKDELSRNTAQFITFEEYRRICRRHSEDDPQQQTMLAGFLHDVGVALNYKEDPRLRFAYVLKPEWVTQGIYALLHAFVMSKGLFSCSHAEHILAPEGYSGEAAHFILGLMEQFELSFALGDNQKRSLIPQLLDDRQPVEAGDFDVLSCLNFGYQYAVLPEGLLPRFIVRTHHISDSKMRWKSGVILHDRSSGCRALVRADAANEQVRIHVDGTEHSRRMLLAIVRHNFDVIHGDLGFQPTELVYPPGAPEDPLPLHKLELLQRRNATSTIPVILPDDSITHPTISSLIEPVKSQPKPLKLFLSYSHKDEKHVVELRKSLRHMHRSGLIRLWYDRELPTGEKWEPRILQELNDADLIVCQLSRDFLNSDFCTLVELATAIKRKERGETELIAYILHDCVWKDVMELKQFQLLPREAKPIDDWRNKHRYWREIAEGIQLAVKTLQQKLLSRRLVR